MTWEDLQNAVRTKFKALMDSLAVSVPVQYDNAPFNKPVGIWCRLTILPSQSEQVQIPGGYRDAGVVVAQLFNTGGEGDGDIVEIADAIKTEFRGVTSDGIRWRVPYLQRIGLQGEEYQLNVLCPYQADDFQ